MSEAERDYDSESVVHPLTHSDLSLTADSSDYEGSAYGDPKKRKSVKIELLPQTTVISVLNKSSGRSRSGSKLGDEDGLGLGLGLGLGTQSPESIPRDINHVSTCANTCTCTCANTYTYTCANTYTYTCANTYTCTCTS
jgi:hypothetical protein